ncbi:MAG: tRNA 2-thiouridine(34) synthase MnmA [Dehalococcoidia bacterium]
MSRTRVIVAMSGGVDSAVAAGLLAREGYDVVGITMRLWTHEDPLAPRYRRRCCPAEDIDDARAAAGALGIPHYVVNMEDEFGRRVVDYFVEEYQRGRTPNPCLPCNEHIKFHALMAHAEALDAPYLATGHYARIERDAGRYRLFAANDTEKDQSYVLYMLGQQELSRVLFPIAAYRKDEIRALAQDLGLPNAAKPDSADICFLPTEDYRDFIAERVPQREGEIVDSDGSVVGRHRGVAGFTVGQRRGLGVALGEKRYVTAIDPSLNVITIGREGDLLASALTAESLRWVAGAPPADEFEAGVKIRYRAASEPATVRIAGDRAVVRFELPLRAVALGQAAVFYRSGEVLGGGIIASSGP